MKVEKSTYYKQSANKTLQKIIDDTLAECTGHLAGSDNLNLWSSSDEKSYPIYISPMGSVLILHLSERSNESNMADVKNYIIAYDATGDHNVAKMYTEKCKNLSSAVPPGPPPEDCTIPAWLLKIAKIIHEVTGITPVDGWELWLLANAESRYDQEVIAITSVKRVAAIVPGSGKLIDVSKLTRELIIGMGTMDPLVIDVKMPELSPYKVGMGVMVQDPGGTCWEDIVREVVQWSDIMAHNIIWRK